MEDTQHNQLEIVHDMPVGAVTHKKKAAYQRIGTYGLVGIVNTGIDFGVLNVLHFHLHWALLASNLASTSTAMIFSFFANKRFVFNTKTSRKLWHQALLFWAVTAAGLYGLQSGIIWLSMHPLASLTNTVARELHSITPLSSAFIVANGVKAVATIASLIWNYLFYKKVVFGHSKTTL